MKNYLFHYILLLIFVKNIYAQNDQQLFSYLDIFNLEYVVDPQISPDGEHIIYRRMGFDIMNDTSFGNLWIIKSDGTNNQKLTSREVDESSARWSHNGDRIAFVSSTEEGSEIYMYWVSSGKIARISQLESSPHNLIWSPDGIHLAFSMNVPEPSPIAAKMPKKPKGAKWADEPRITDRLKHESDGSGYIKPGFKHIFVISADGGYPRKITSGNYHHGGLLSWSPDNEKIYFSANRTDNWEYDFRNSEVYSVNIVSGKIIILTSRKGPDTSPKISPNGKYIAYIGFEDRYQAHQTMELHLMNADGSNKKLISESLDRNVSGIIWDAKSNGLYFTYDDKGNSKIAHISTIGEIKKIADNLGGTSIGRPYAGGSFSVSEEGKIVYTLSRPNFPAELAVHNTRSVQKITNLNQDLFQYKNLGKVEEIWYKSSFDERDIQGWIVYPPNYDSSKKYPLLVENHGGPILNYGDRFSAEIQLYASAGYIVFYPNPRGSTSYGEEFANLLKNNYPGEDYNDVMDGVDTLIKKGIAHEDQLYVTGGSAGGIMTAWMIGKNNRFEAAVVVKPVMNWISKTLVADNYFYYANSRYTGQPWENFEEYWKFSPISLVGNIETPTMVMVGMNDLRTPPSEAKQLYHALKLRKIHTVLVEIPDASHGIAKRPSNLIAKVANTLAWLEKYRKQEED